jgi:outer membrane protein assembly factor BamB
MAKVPNVRKMAYGSAPRATPCIYKGKVITLGAFGDLHCYDLKTGKPIWQKDYRKDFGAPAKPPEWGYSVPPIIVDGKLILMPGDLIALEPETGKLIWRVKTAGPNYAAFTPATIGQSRQVIGYDANGAGGWNVADGSRLWSLPADNSKGYIVPSPVMIGEKLLLAEESNNARLLGFTADGKIETTPLAESKRLAPEIATPTIVGSLVLGATSGLVCLDPADELKTLWTQDEEDAFQGLAHIIAGGDRAMVFGDKGEMVMIRATREKCEILGRAKLCGTDKSSIVWAHPAIAGGIIFVRDEKFIYAWRMVAPATAG